MNGSSPPSMVRGSSTSSSAYMAGPKRPFRRAVVEMEYFPSELREKGPVNFLKVIFFQRK